MLTMRCVPSTERPAIDCKAHAVPPYLTWPSCLLQEVEEDREEWGGPKGPEPTRYGAPCRRCHAREATAWTSMECASCFCAPLQLMIPSSTELEMIVMLSMQGTGSNAGGVVTSDGPEKLWPK